MDRLDLDVQAGEIFGLLGPNGAGKTTTAGMLTTRVLPTSGRAFLAGVDVAARPALAKQLSGIVSQQNTLDRQLTVWENLYFHGRLFGMGAKTFRQVADDLLARFQLSRWARASVYALSGGMAQRLMVARAIFHRPSVLFLDEPTAGLDPQSLVVPPFVVAGESAHDAPDGAEQADVRAGGADGGERGQAVLEPVDLLQLRDAHGAARALQQLVGRRSSLLAQAREFAEAELEDACHAGRAAARLDRAVQLRQVATGPETGSRTVRPRAARAPITMRLPKMMAQEISEASSSSRNHELHRDTRLRPISRTIDNGSPIHQSALPPDAASTRKSGSRLGCSVRASTQTTRTFASTSSVLRCPVASPPR